VPPIRRCELHPPNVKRSLNSRDSPQHGQTAGTISYQPGNPDRPRQLSMRDHPEGFHAADYCCCGRSCLGTLLQPASARMIPKKPWIAYDRKCEQLGFKRGTAEHVKCRLELARHATPARWPRNQTKPSTPMRLRAAKFGWLIGKQVGKPQPYPLYAIQAAAHKKTFSCRSVACSQRSETRAKLAGVVKYVTSRDRS
jgi:hypothetical protein